MAWQNTAAAQDSVAKFDSDLPEKEVFVDSDLTALEDGQTVVKLLSVQDKREMAACGLVRLQVQPEAFLQSFLSMVRKNNPAVLEIGSFSNIPNPDDLQTLTVEDRDIEDLKTYVVGDCKLKLSAIPLAR